MDDTILPPSWWPKFTGSILNRGSWMMQSYHLLDDQSSPDPFWTEVHGWCNPTTFSMTEVHRIHSELRFMDDAILPPSRWPNFTESILDICLGMIQSSDPFWTKVHGWYNPTTFSMTEVTGSILDISPRMIQSPDLFRESAQGWYNPTATSLLPLSGKVFPNHTKLVSKVFKLYSR